VRLFPASSIVLPRWEPLHPDFVVAMRVLDSFGLPYAELLRQLRPVSARLGVPRPSYWRVRRFVIADRRRKTENSEALNRVLRDLFAGRSPIHRGVMQHKVG
jgi:hypothetical protein